MKILNSKKRDLFLSTTLTVVTLLITTACKEDRVEEMACADAYAQSSELLNRLKTFNETLDEEYYVSRGDVGQNQITDIIIADAQGAYKGSKAIGKIASLSGSNIRGIGYETGGVIIGSAASYKRYLEIEQAKFSTPMGTDARIITDQETFTAGYAVTKDKVEKKDYALGMSCGLDSCSTRVGILHNKVLDEIAQIENLGNQKELLSLLNPKEKDLTESDDFKAAFNSILYYSSDTSISQTACDQVISLFVEAVKKTDEKFDNVYRIISNYVVIVKDSKELSEEDKQSLYIGFAVMGYSYTYWSERLPNLSEKHIED